MKYALVIIEQVSDVDASREALGLLSNEVLSSASQMPQVERLNGGTYLVKLEHGLHDLAHLCALVAHRKLHYRTLFFEEAPPFVITKDRDRA